jgi:enoyl-CoA hydratase/carnithine racemase
MNSVTQASVDVERRGAVGWITLNRPAAINAINDSMRQQLPAALVALNDDDSVRVIVLRGAGERGFCSGADLKEKPAAAASGEIPARPGWIEEFDRIAKPMVAAIHGYCFGGGLEIALACDLRIASADAVFALPETGLGLIPGGGGTQRLPRLIGLGRSFDLLVTGERIDAAKALEWGLITRLVATRNALEEESAALADLIAARPPIATRHAKQAAKRGMELGLHAGLALERALFSELVSGDERREAVAAFRERHAPASNTSSK